MPVGRSFNRWRLIPVVAPGRTFAVIWEVPTGSNLLERLRTESELMSVGRARFTGTLAQKNRLWLVYRNLLRQAMSNFRAALTVENRSASLLYYYAMLNFAKAEVLRSNPTAVQGFVGHGLRFSGTKAKSVGGDSLTVVDGVFRLLYERRTGFVLPVGTRLPVKRLLANIPEIGEQLEAVNAGTSLAVGVLQLIARDASNAWALLAITPGAGLEQKSATGRYFRKAFRMVDPPNNWRDRFALSRRWPAMDFYESTSQFPYTPGNDLEAEDAIGRAASSTWNVADVLGLSTSSMWDAWLVPSLYKARMVPFPPSLARYAMSFYASSLVRYRPAMFDAQASPEQAYLFDSLARECAVPMLIDTVAALTERDPFFAGDDGMRL